MSYQHKAQQYISISNPTMHKKIIHHPKMGFILGVQAGSMLQTELRYIIILMS